VIERRRNLPPMLCGDHHGSPVEITSPPVVPQPLPGPQHITQWGLGTTGRSRERTDEPLVGGNDPGQLGLLGHHLANEDGPRITGGPPWELRPSRPGAFILPPSGDGPADGPDLVGGSDPTELVGPTAYLAQLQTWSP